MAYQTEIDFGSTPVSEGTFLISLPNYSDGAIVIAKVAYAAPTGKDLDELEMDSLDIRCGNSNNGQFSMYITSRDGSYLHDKFLISYKVVYG